MTLVVAVTSPDSIWLLADRRLSYGHRRPPKDDGRKVMFLETTDGVAILGYAGLGATALGTEPADWMSAVLRGRNLPLEQSLGVLAKAMQRQLPRHMIRIPVSQGLAHHVIVPAFFGEEPRLYSIDLVFAPDRRSYRFRYTRHVQPPRGAPPRIGIGGSGAFHLRRDKKWMRTLLRMVRASDRDIVSPRAVADYLATLDSEVAAADESVGPRCIVAWRFRREGPRKGGGGHAFYTGTKQDASGPFLPMIVTGTDVRALVRVQMAHMEDMMKAMLAGESAPELDKDEINAVLARLPHGPDETLR